MINSEHREIAQWAMEFALKKGCTSVRVSVVVATNNSFEYRNTQLDKLHQSSENKLYIELFIDGRYGALSTNRLEKSELEVFITEGITSTRYLSVDNCRQLPDSSRYWTKDNDLDLDLFDDQFFSYTTDQKIDLLKSAVGEIYGNDERIVSITASYDDGCGGEYMVASNGFEGEEKDTSYTLSAEVSLKTEGDARPESYWYDSRLHWADLQKDGIARKALQRAMQKLGQEKIKSGTYSMLLDNTVSGRLFSPLISAMYGGAIQQKNSFLLNKLGQQIVSPLLSIEDHPHEVRTLGARLFDGEGVQTYNQFIIENGVLNTYFIDTYNAFKLKMEPTVASPSVLKMKQGNKNCEQLICSMDTGVLVTGFNGGNTNSTTGDFSFGVEGFWIEGGIAVKPISEMNVTGNILDLWTKLVEVGNDPLSIASSRQIPSLLFERINFSGL